MPNPSSVYCAKSFAVEAEMQAYADGLRKGMDFESQPGSDPSRVRTEKNLCSVSERFHAYIESGYYDNDGNIIW